MVPKVFLSQFSLSHEGMNAFVPLVSLSQKLIATVSDAAVSGVRMRKTKVLQDSVISSATPCHMSPSP